MGKYSVNKQPHDVLLELAAKFREIRKNQNLSRRELSERSGVSESSIKRFELTGKVSLESLLRITHLVDRLLDFENVFSKIESNYNDVEKLFSHKTKRK